jgi:Divergent InlB B-repeat domain
VVLLAASAFSALALGAGSGAALPTTHATTAVVAPKPAMQAPVTGPGTADRASEITAGMGWAGIDYRSACPACLPADPVLAVGAGYVVELANGTERVWLVNGTQVFNQSLGALFNSSADSLASPQAQFDVSSLHWFVSVVDVTSGQILLAASLSSDPTGTWNVVPITPPNASTAREPMLAVDTTDVVVTANVSSSDGTFEGAQVWVANKTDLLSGGTTPPVPVGVPDGQTNALVPATPLSGSSTLYLVDDGIGASGPLQLFALTGTPPDTVTLFGPANFTTNLSAPPNALQNGSANLLSLGDGEIQSAAWRADTLWAAATGACTPANDSQVRSCLHLWEVDTATGTLQQDFDWSSGAGTYDFDPAVSIAVRGDLAVVYGASSATFDPSIFATGQAVTDSGGSLEGPTPLHNGTGPYSPGTGCANGVCPFESDFAIAFTPATNVHFWAVGVYTTHNFAWDAWKTWVNQVAAWRTVPVSFNETGLPTGTSWSVSVNGETATSSGPSIALAEDNGSFTFLIVSPIAGGPGVRYVATPLSGTFTVDAAAVVETVAFLQQFQLSASADPGADGSVYPGGGWFDADSTVSLSALAAPGFQFTSWTGDGPGAYAGDANPVSFTLQGPDVEQAHYWASATYPVAFVETGLPAGTDWTVTVNGLSNGTSGTTVGFNEPNGTYSFTVTDLLPGAPGTQYAASAPSGSFDLTGTGTHLGVDYLAQFLLEATPASPGTGAVNPPSGWFGSGSTVNLSALAAPGEQFAGWVGSGSGAYTGGANPAPVIMDAPVTEEARFSSATTYPITYAESGLPSGASWTVTTNGVRDTSSATTVVFNEPSGNYSFGVQTTARTPNGTAFVATPAFGVFVVTNAALAESIRFLPLAVPPTPSGTETGATGPSGIPVWVFGVALAAFLIVVAGLALVLRARSEAVAEPVVTYVMAPPPPDWDESSLQRRGG